MPPDESQDGSLRQLRLTHRQRVQVDVCFAFLDVFKLHIFWTASTDTSALQKCSIQVQNTTKQPKPLETHPDWIVLRWAAENASAFGRVAIAPLLKQKKLESLLHFHSLCPLWCSIEIRSVCGYMI